MQFVDGIDLKEWRRQHKDIEQRDAKEMYHLIKPIFEALGHAHKYTIHRDIKPANIMLGKNGYIYLMDFGIAKAYASEAGLGPTSIRTRSELIGTPEFLSPAQILDQPIGPGVDVFAFGSLAYTLLTGESPFSAESTVDIMRKIIDVSYQPATELLPSLPPELDEFLGRALTPTPEARATIEEMHHSLGQFLASSKIFNSRLPIRDWLAEKSITVGAEA